MKNFLGNFFNNNNDTQNEEIIISDDLILDDVFNVSDESDVVAIAGEGMLANPNACKAAHE